MCVRDVPDDKDIKLMNILINYYLFNFKSSVTAFNINHYFNNSTICLFYFPQEQNIKKLTDGLFFVKG